MINLGLVTEFDQIKDVALPSLLLAKNISPSIGLIMSVIMILVIYNTVVGLMYAFAARFSTPFTKKYFILIISMAIVTFICTFVGFISLIGKVFPIMGLFGFILLIPIFYKGLKTLIIAMTGWHISMPTFLYLIIDSLGNINCGGV